MTTIMDTDDEPTTLSVISAVKNLAKVHHLPPFDRLYSSDRQTVIAVARLDACLWRAALGLPPFDANGQTEGFWMSDKIRLVKLAPPVE